MMRLLQISDTHFGTEQADVIEALKALVARLRPDVLLLSGDVTQRARSVQFESARRFVDALAIHPSVVLPGNHDVPLYNILQRVFDPYRNYRRAFPGPLESQIQRDDLMLLTVKTTRRWRHKHGQVDAAQIARVASRLRTATQQQLRVVAVHQPMHVPRPQDEVNLLRNAETAARVWSEAGADLVLGGHIHLPYVLPMSQRFVGLPRELWCVQAGTALSSRVRWEAPNSVNVIEYGADQRAATCRVQRWDHDGVAACFAQVSETSINLQR